MTLYPNPTKGNVTIIAKGQLLERVQVMDICGRVVQQHSFNNQQTVGIDLSQIASAVYLLNVQTENGGVTKRIIKE